MNYHWNWTIFWEQAPDGTGTYFDNLIVGMNWTLATSALAWTIALVLGLTIGTLRAYTNPNGTFPRRWVNRLANGYVELFRNIPLLVQMFIWYFVVPELLPQSAGDWVKSLPNAAFVTAFICLGFFTSARVAVQVTAGIQVLPLGQKMAGQALGLSLFQTYRYVLLPNAFRIIIPSLTNELTGMIKNTSVALTIGVMELTAQARSMQEFSFQTFEAFTAATLIYLIVSLIAILLANLLEKKMRIPGMIISTSSKPVAN